MNTESTSKDQVDRPVVAVVDDDPSITLLFKAYLEPTYKVCAFTESTVAMSWLDVTPRVDLVIADLLMPECNGIDLVNHIRKSGRTRLTPVIVLSGTKKTDDRVNVLRSGADDFVGKPISREELRARVDIQLRRVKPPAVVNAMPFRSSIMASSHFIYDWPPRKKRLDERPTSRSRHTPGNPRKS